MDEYYQMRKEKQQALQQRIEEYQEASNYRLSELLGVSEGYVRKSHGKI
jgi:DeoR/GlpR family transcriptional regulator of sugar metabolism